MSVESLDAAGSSPVATETPTPVACCQSKWRMGFQVPLLLFAAGGLGFAGHQISQSPDFNELLTGQPAIPACSMSGGHCCPSTMEATAVATTGCCPSELAETQACAMANVDRENSEEATAVSALTPANLMPEQTDIGTSAALETL